jgi:hypothetical protein
MYLKLDCDATLIESANVDAPEEDGGRTSNETHFQSIKFSGAAVLYV